MLLSQFILCPYSYTISDYCFSSFIQYHSISLRSWKMRATTICQMESAKEAAKVDPCLKTLSNNSSNNNSNKEQGRFLPIANTGRIMKKVIPANGKISEDAKETVQECASEFISFVTGEASDKCQREKRKSINGDDIIWAITVLAFEDYVDPLKCYLQKHRNIEGEKLNIPKQQRSEQRLHHHHHHQD